MTPPTNTYTVTFSDAHSHSVQFAATPGSANAAVNGKVDALLNVLGSPITAEGSALSALTATDTLTITVTQP